MSTRRLAHAVLALCLAHTSVYSAEAWQQLPRFDWEQFRRTTFAEATSIRVRHWSYGRVGGWADLFEPTGPPAVRELRDCFAVNTDPGAHLCGCDKVVLEFRAKGRKLDVLLVTSCSGSIPRKGMVGGKLTASSLNRLCTWLARKGLSSPHKSGRLDTLVALKGFRTPLCRSLLLSVFRERFPFRLSRDERTEHERAQAGAAAPRESNLYPVGCSEGVLAGSLLAGLGEESILPELRKRLPGASAADKKLLQEAIATLARLAKQREK